MIYSDDELLHLMTNLESDLVERKQSFNNSTSDAIRQAVCAFANDLPDHRACGVVFVGVNDNGIPIGLSITDELLQSLSDIKTDGNTLPPPTLAVEQRLLGGANVAVITVKPSDAPPVRYRGRIWIRIGPRRAIATSQDERILNEKRRYRDIPFDLQPVPSATLTDINIRAFEEEYLPVAFAPDILQANARSLEQRLAATKMVVGADDPVPTVMGMVVLGKATRDFIPGNYLQFVRFSGTGLSDEVIDEDVADGPLTEMVKKIEAKLDSHNRTSVNFTSGTIQTRSTSYPIVAFQQIIRNAVMHRTYEASNAPVRVYWFDDRVEIISPGGPFGSVTQQNFGQPGITDYRNPNLAEAMKVLGFVQRFGAGIAIARKALNDNGNAPLSFETNQSVVVCKLEKHA